VRSNRGHTLEQKRSGKAATADFVVQVALVFHDANLA
jgi:hypothetical protein